MYDLLIFDQIWIKQSHFTCATSLIYTLPQSGWRLVSRKLGRGSMGNACYSKTKQSLTGLQTSSVQCWDKRLLYIGTRGFCTLAQSRWQVAVFIRQEAWDIERTPRNHGWQHAWVMAWCCWHWDFRHDYHLVSWLVTWSSLHVMWCSWQVKYYNSIGHFIARCNIISFFAN